MIKAILVPVDLSDSDAAAALLAVGVDLARHHGAVLHVVSVLPDFGMASVGIFFKADYEKQAIHGFGQGLSDFVLRNVPDGVEAQPHVLHGTVYDEILRAADKLEVDLIVIGSHRPKLRDYLLGPNAARVVRHARQSVYVVRDR